jgi:hypothetical protein
MTYSNLVSQTSYCKKIKNYLSPATYLFLVIWASLN